VFILPPAVQLVPLYSSEEFTLLSAVGKPSDPAKAKAAVCVPLPP
jgi:hypothetical protein